MQIQEKAVIIWVVLPSVTAVRCLPVFCMSGLCDWPLPTSADSWEAAFLIWEFLGETKLKFLLNETAFQSVICISHVRPSDL